MKAVFSEDTRHHDPKFYLLRGKVRQAAEQPERATRLLAGLAAGGHTVVPAERIGHGPRARVHGIDYLTFMAEAWDLWSAMPDAGPELIANIHPCRETTTYPTHVIGRLGWHTVDTSCPIGPGTYQAACAATDTAATAARLVRDGEAASYALCRPPGHHAFRDRAGGHCFFNNSAIAATELRERYGRVAILDVDVHHGNGTQGIFYRDPTVLTVSIHADPAAFYPFLWGFAHERGEGEGHGTNLNLPLPLGTGDDGYLAVLSGSATRMIRAFDPGALVVALGLDASEHDPLGGLAVSTEGFRRIGEAIARLGLPTVFVQEGGYLSDHLGPNLTAVLGGFSQVR